jgi:hypothetical protein
MEMDEIIRRARVLATFDAAWDTCEWEGWSAEDRRLCLTMACYEAARQHTRNTMGQRRALRLFRSWCDSGQRQQLRRCGYIYATGSAGGVYRLHPYCGHTERVERHGNRWFARTRFCYHDVEERLPHADVALAHLLLIRADEPEFLLRANERPARHGLWDASYNRRLARHRAWRSAEAA